LDGVRVELLRQNGLAPERQTDFPFSAMSATEIPPTPFRMNANPNFTGKGIGICFIDSGFYPHPDLVKPSNRILAIRDIATPKRVQGYFAKPHPQSWHGTMTAVVCAGSGYLSDSFYKGIACDANLVLLKVQNDAGISGEHITEAILWATKNRDKFNIRIVNLSVTDDWPESYKNSAVDQAAEEAIKAGIVVVAAVGNDPNAEVKPPANSPNVLSVGGTNDHNTPDPHDDTLYHSTYGTTVDDFLKPELIAPAIWIAAPILPDTAEQLEAEALQHFLHLDGQDLKDALRRQISNTRLDVRLREESSIDRIKQAIRNRINEAKYISPHYMHVDGTSFAAPLVCSVVAQMLQANPALTPAVVREILLSTARNLTGVPVDRQGYGMVDAPSAVSQSEKESHAFPREREHSGVVDKVNHKIVFYYHNHEATGVMLVGDFNAWSVTGFLFSQGENGRWKIELPMLPPGEYRYKFLLDGMRWISDPRNPFTEPDGFNGLNSKFVVE